MGREVRRVSKDWEHPTGENGEYMPLFSPEEWMSKGKYYQEYPESFEGERKEINLFDPKDYMPLTKIEDRPLLMMYETTTEGTPISPAFKTPEELARWLADNGASSFGSMTSSYEDWLETCKKGWAVSAVMEKGVMKPGVGL